MSTLRAQKDTFSIHLLAKEKSPRLPYSRMKEVVLGTKYELSLVFADEKTSRTLNRAHRGKDRSANVLSFPLSDSSGEIIMCMARATKDAPAFGMNLRSFVGFLFIHACLHLKGMEHGSTMERKERAYAAQFGFRAR